MRRRPRRRGHRNAGLNLRSNLNRRSRLSQLAEEIESAARAEHDTPLLVIVSPTFEKGQYSVPPDSPYTPDERRQIERAEQESGGRPLMVIRVINRPRPRDAYGRELDEDGNVLPEYRRY